ncbi:MAG TPA: CRISPR-associated endonuclease Cas2 [Candidatus Acidoferrales bacterium]|nr:CRISPR-associated endonuclease Cas2 [Candidatus Acidoferrales bacterium]
MQARYLVCYDIADPRRLNRACRFMKERGLHLQLSVFLCSLSWPELSELKLSLRQLIDEAEDDVRIYPLPGAGPIVALGLGDRVGEGIAVHLS